VTGLGIWVVIVVGTALVALVVTAFEMLAKKRRRGSKKLP